MVNAWSLLYDEYYGTMNETFPVKNDEPDDTVVISTGSTASATFVNFDLNDQIENITIDTSNHDTLDFSTLELPDGMSVNYDMDPDLSYMEPGTVLSTEGVETLNIKMPDDYPSAFTTLSDNDDVLENIRKMSLSKLFRIIFLPLMVDTILLIIIMSRHLILLSQ